MTYDVLAWLRDILAIMLLLGNFSVVVLTIAGRDLSNKGIVRAAGLLVLSILAILISDTRGIFPNRWPAVFMVLATVGLWLVVRRAKAARW